MTYFYSVFYCRLWAGKCLVGPTYQVINTEILLQWQIWIKHLIQWKQKSLRRLQDVLKMSRRLTTKQDVVTTSGKRRSIYDVLKTRGLRHLDDIQFRTSWRCLIYDILRTSDLRRLEDFQFTTSWRRLIYDFLWTSDLRRLEDVCKATSVKQRRSGVYATSKEMFFFLILYCLKYSENFKCSCLD